MKSKIISIVLLATLMLSMAAIFPIRADVADVEFKVTPTNNDYNYPATAVGTKFNITVMWLDESPYANVYSWQVKLVLNDTTLLACNKAWQPTWDGNYLLKPQEPNWNHPAAAGLGTNEITIMGTLQAPATAVWSASAKLAIFELEILRAPAKYETLYGSLSINNVDSIWSPDGTNWNDPIKTDGAFKYAWTAPASPHLEVSPASVEFGPAPCVGQEFDIMVYLMGIDAAWAMHNVSFRLTYTAVPQLLEVAKITIDAFWTPTLVDNTTIVDVIDIKADATAVPSGNKLIATIRFRIIYQGTAPEADHNEPLTLSNIILFDTLQQIPADPAVNGNVKVKSWIPFTPPHLEVSNPTLGPGPVPVGTLFDVTVSIKELNASAYFIGYDFRLSYDPAVMAPVSAAEGPFLPYYAALQPGSLGTWWYYSPETNGGYGPHVLVGNLIFPNETGKWWYPFPEGDGVVAIITFSCLVEQSFGEADITSELKIIEEDHVGIDNPEGAQNIVDVLYNDPVNGTFTLTTNWPGRMIDLYDQYPAPFGGQGLQMPSDMFWPQKQVELYANVTYNYWPVQQKDVAFEVRDPHGTLVTIQVARTDANGVAHTWYRIPWPCDHPEDYFGVWTVTATVDLACIVITDTMQFHFDYMVEIFKVTTDKFQVNHYDCFNVIIEYGSHAQQEYPVVLQAILYDNLNVPVAQGYVETTVGGTVFCQYKNNTVIIPLCVPKYAFAGIANIYVNAYDALPTQGGSAWCPTYGLTNPFGYAWPIGSTVPVVAIQPR
jgi:hypothetical protein